MNLKSKFRQANSLLLYSFSVSARTRLIEVLDVIGVCRGTTEWPDHATSYRSVISAVYRKRSSLKLSTCQ
jgi:hypothetical protein